MPRREAFNEKKRSHRRVSPFVRELLESTDRSLGNGQFIAGFVEREVSR
jgi:hypothetical protein